MRRLPTVSPALFALVLLGTFAALQQVFGAVRPFSLGDAETDRLIVSSPADDGPGSLRAALFTLARVDRPMTIVLRVPTIEVTTPLPPVFNSRGVTLVSAGAPVVLDASALTSGPALDLAAPATTLSGVHVKNAREIGILVRGSNSELRDFAVSGSGDAVVVWQGASDIRISGGRFSNNEVGVKVSGTTSRVAIVDGRFEQHSNAAIWAVRPHGETLANAEPISVRGNVLVGGRYGVVLGNGVGTVEDNDIVASGEAAIVALSSKVLIEGNRVREGRAVGILVDASAGARVFDNEVDHNGATGIMVRSTAGAEVRGNRVHSNGYGIMSLLGPSAKPSQLVDNLLLRNVEDGLLVIGESPLVHGNRASGNGKAGLRTLDYVRRNGSRLPAKPFLEHNEWSGNESDAPAHGEWREPGAPS